MAASTGFRVPSVVDIVGLAFHAVRLVSDDILVTAAGAVGPASYIMATFVAGIQQRSLHKHSGQQAEGSRGTQNISLMACLLVILAGGFFVQAPRQNAQSR